MAVLCVNAGPVNGTADFTVSLTELGIRSSKGAVVRVRDAIESILYYMYILHGYVYTLMEYIYPFSKKNQTHSRILMGDVHLCSVSPESVANVSSI